MMQGRFMIIALRLLILILAWSVLPDRKETEEDLLPGRTEIVKGAIRAIRDAKRLIADLERFHKV
jgi:hypothetical protein